jgi:DNA-damage-inducible protein J
MGSFMAASVTVRARIEESLKNEATEILSGMGLTVSDVIRIAITKIAKDKVLPFDMAALTAIGMAAPVNSASASTTEACEGSAFGHWLEAHPTAGMGEALAALGIHIRASHGEPTTMTALQLFDQAFSTPRSPRSMEYQQGVLDSLMVRLGEIPESGDKVPFALGTPQLDAYLSGCEEGHRIARDHLVWFS